MERDTFQTVVVFRVFKDQGDLVALFPHEAYNYKYCSSYQRIGQHGGADYAYCIKASRAAKPNEYTALAKELEGLGYNLKIQTRKGSVK